MSRLPLQAADAAWDSVRPYASVTVAVIDWDVPVEPADRPLEIAALPDPTAPLTGCSVMLSHGELGIHEPLILGDLSYHNVQWEYRTVNLGGGCSPPQVRVNIRQNA